MKKIFYGIENQPVNNKTNSQSCTSDLNMQFLKKLKEYGHKKYFFLDLCILNFISLNLQIKITVL